MGAGDSMRQGFVLSRPDMAGKTISVIGDSCECHSGLDSTRNSVFRNVAGVKVVLDNRITAMTGGQPAPSSNVNLAGVPNKFNLVKALEAEEARVSVVSSYDLKGIEKELINSLELADKGEFTTIVLEGACIHEVENKKKAKSLKINHEKCKKCGLCNICPGIVLDENKSPSFTNLCTNCAGSNNVCMQRCPYGAIEIMDENDKKNEILENAISNLTALKDLKDIKISKDDLPKCLRVAIRGIGGQGNLFFGKILSLVTLNTPYSNTHIVKGDTHGMAQLGGPVISTFACGDVNSPVFAPYSADVLVVMEASEVLRPGFLELLKPNGRIIFNRFCAIPINTKKEDYPDINDIENLLKDYNVIKIDANKIAYQYGDKSAKTANVVVLGLLSTLEPFDKIPEDIWLSSLMKLSPNDKKNKIRGDFYYDKQRANRSKINCSYRCFK